ncbi:MAG: 4Fe-4S binding protein [Wenzhouxiangellaceae bacterium]
MTETPTDRDGEIQWPASTRAGQARAVALEALEPMPQPQEWVEYKSSGRLLIIGPADDALPLARVLDEHLSCVLLATRPPGEPPETAPPVRYLDGRPRNLAGYLGAFTLDVEVDRGRVLEAGAAFGIESGTFDLVLDLDGSGGLRMDEPPPGYYLAIDPAGRERALEELPEMVGDFQKSRYFAYDPDICAHGASGMTGCSNCLLACATEAIVSIGDKVEVNPYLCQGCGSCATVCPTGAMQYQAPPVVEVIDGARRMLKTFRDHAGDDPAPEILLYSADSAQPELSAHADDLPEHVLPLAVEDVGSVGMDALLSLLAFGAVRVLLLPGPSPAPSKVQASQSMIQVLDRMLEALGDRQHAERVVWLDGAGEAAAHDPIAPMVSEPAAFSGLGNKREVIRRALKVLHEQAAAPLETAALPAQATFGAIEVDPAACTLCMGCVSVCPASAVQGGGDRPRLEFREDHCVQCGLCEQACPEDAITLQPRINFQAHLEPHSSLLNEAPMHHCPDCGKAFATEQMIERMLGRLADHWMYQDENARKRLLLCEDCRIKKMWDEEGAIDVHRAKRP